MLKKYFEKKLAMNRESGRENFLFVPIRAIRG
jgi:hypothetical protein